MKTKLKHIFIFSAIFLALLNGPILVSDFYTYKSMPLNASIETFKNIIYIFTALFALFFGFSSNRILFTIGSLIVFMIGAISTYYIYVFGIVITPEVIKVIFHNEIADAKELISIKVIIWYLAVSYIWFILIKRYLRVETSFNKWNPIISILLLIFSVQFLIKPEFKLYKKFVPWQTTSSFATFLKKGSQNDKIDISKEAEFASVDQIDKTIVLVIGESARYDHFGINGYERDTTPLLSGIDNLFSFYANSCASMTYLSVSCMLSRYSKENFDINQNETTILSIFNKLGYHTAWFGSQSIAKYFEDKAGGTFYDEAKTLIIPGGSALYGMNDHDEVMLPFIEDYLKKDGNKFIVIHTIGSHWDYAKRYPAKFKKFEPHCEPPLWGKRDYSDCTNEELTSIYDNSILYTDYFLSKVIEILKNKNSLMIYTSDHAVSLGEDRKYGQGGNVKEQFEVPFIVFASDQYLQHNPSFKEKISTLKNSKISHDYVFHSLLGCANIRSNMIQPSLNLCN